MRSLYSRGLAALVLLATLASLVYVLRPDNAAADESLTRTQVMDRARSWLGRSDIPYSMNTCYTADGTRTPCGHPNVFRADCSGFVSLAWGVNNLTVGTTNPALTPLAGNASKSIEINKSDLKPGDALAYFEGAGANAHIALFIRWTDQVGGPAVVWEQAGGQTGPRENIWPNHGKYTAYRYNAIQEDAPPAPEGSTVQQPEVAEHDHNHYTYFDASPGGSKLTPTVANASKEDMTPIISWNYLNPAQHVSKNSFFWWGKRHSLNGAYKRLHAEHSGKCIGVHGYQVIQHSCSNNSDHFWAVVDEANETGKLKNLATGTCMHMGWDNGNPAVLGTCEGDRSRLTIATSAKKIDQVKTGPDYRDHPHETR